MFTLKRFSLAAALITLTGCTISSGKQADNYYDNDFSLETSKTEKTQASEITATETTGFTSNTPIVSEVGKKVAAIETKLRQIQKNLKKDTETFKGLKTKNAEESGRYYEYIARIQSRLQLGTTPGNPELTEMWKQASALLAGADKNISDTAKVSSEMVRTKNELDSLLENIRETYRVPGAMEIDHENLKALEDEANQTIISLNRLSSELSLQITRQQQFFTVESQNINSLSMDIQSGVITNNARRQQTENVSPTPAAPAVPTYLPTTEELPDADLEGRRALLTIPFNKRKVNYEQSLYKAVKAALDKRPATKFEIVAVSPVSTKNGAKEAAKNAEAVKDSLISMGLPTSRIYSSKTVDTAVKTTEVRLYLRQ